MKRIILISNTSWSLYKFRAGLIRRLVEEKNEVILLSAADQYVDDLKKLGARFIPLKYMMGKGLNPLRELLLINELNILYKTERPDIVFQYTIKPNIYSSIVATRLNIPVIAVITGLGYTFINRGIVPRLAKSLYKAALKRVNKTWFLNVDDQNSFVTANLVDINKTSVIPGEGINCELYSPIGSSKDKDKIRFILPARMLYDKGVKEYIDAAMMVNKEYPATEFNLLGFVNSDNPSAIPLFRIEEWSRNSFINYLGSVDDVRSIIEQHNCVVLPSYREGMSMALMESASLELPLIASNIPGCRQLIEHGTTGYLCKSKNAEDLAKQMITFLKLPSDKQLEMGRNGRRKMQKEFDEKIIIELYLKALKELTM